MSIRLPFSGIGSPSLKTGSDLMFVPFTNFLVYDIAIPYRPVPEKAFLNPDTSDECMRKHAKTETRKECFGILDRVFPMGDKGLREIVPSCFDCHDRVACLKAALTTKEGLTFRGEILERSSAKGLGGRLRRWSEKKQLSRLMKERPGKGK